MLSRALVSHGTRAAGRALAALGVRGRTEVTRRCGLLAICDDVWSAAAGSSGAPATSDILTNAASLIETTDRITHRGPDGRQIAQGSLGENGVWAMGHRRLAIVDPHTPSADQPFVLELPRVQDGEVTGQRSIRLAANGEIYNHRELYERLVRENNWTGPRTSGSDSEVIAHAYACLGPEATAKALDGMFAFVIFEEAKDGRPARAFAARDSVGIKPLYMGRTGAGDGAGYAWASELKALVGHVVPESVIEVPAGHYWTPETGLQRYYKPRWLTDSSFKPWEAGAEPSQEEVVAGLDAAVRKRMMADVEYGFFLSGGVDSCIVSSLLVPHWRRQVGDDRPIPAFTVGMENSPDMMAARAMADALGGPRRVDHRERVFTADEALGLIEKIVFHMETYEAELIRSAIPNWLLAERAAADVKMVLTGEGADELFAGYLYFADSPNADAVQGELRRIYSKLGQINLLRTDRMTMAHGLEARVPFLDTFFTATAMAVDPQRKTVDRAAVAANTEGREKTYLRKLFEGDNADGAAIPREVLWRAKAMQCEGVGEGWVQTLQRTIAAKVSDADMADAPRRYPLNTPQTKEELYYRQLFEDYYPGMAHVVSPWEGGCRAGGASWESGMYTREGIADVNVLTHALQNSEEVRASLQGSD